MTDLENTLTLMLDKVNRLEAVVENLRSLPVPALATAATGNTVVLRDASGNATVTALAGNTTGTHTGAVVATTISASSTSALSAVTATTVTGSGKITTNASGGGTSAGLYASAAIPALGLNVTGGATDEKNYDIAAIASLPSILFRLINDASSAATTYMAVVRSGMTATSLGLIATNVNITGIFAATPPVWTTPTLGNSWVAYGAPYSTAQYCIDAQGFVHLRGVIKSGTVPSTFFTLPSGFRPTAQRLFIVLSNSVAATVQVYTSGAVQLEAGGSNVFVSLDNIVFPTN